MHVRQFGLQDALLLQALSHLRRPERGFRRITRSVVISFLMIAAIPMTPQSCAVHLGRDFRSRAALAVVFAVVGLLLAIPACNSSSHGPSAPAPASADEEYNGPPLFEDVTSTSGVKLTYRNGEEANNFAIIESLGGGVALLDYDGDGRLDVFVPAGGYYDGKKVLGHPCKLYRNLGGLQVRGRQREGRARQGRLPVQPRRGRFRLRLRRLDRPPRHRLQPARAAPQRIRRAGGRRFVDVTKKAGLDDELWSTSAAWGDLDGDGYPEIYVDHYGDWGFDTNHPTDCTYDGKTRDVCQPRQVQAAPAHALPEQRRRHLHRRHRAAQTSQGRQGNRRARSWT